MKIAVVQLGPTFGEIDENMRRALSMVESEEADVYVLPELVLSGYLFESTKEALSLSQEPGGREFDVLSDFARSRRAAVILGFAERSGDRVYNASLLLAPDGRRAVYRKIQLFWGEKRIFEPGDRRPDVVEAAGARLGMMICFDWVFPEVARTLALAGAEILCHPSNLVLPYCQAAMVTRCLENRVFAVTANRVGTEARCGESLTFTGNSQIVAPNGEVLARAGCDRDEMLVVEIDPALAHEKRLTPTNDVLADRRPDLYGL